MTSIEWTRNADGTQGKTWNPNKRSIRGSLTRSNISDPRAASTAGGLANTYYGGVSMADGTTSAEWRSVPGYDGYSVTRDGRMRGPSGRELRPMTAHAGHRYIFATRPGVPRKLFVHRAVLLAWSGPPKPHQRDARHLNDIPWDNRLENLAWGTSLENAADKVRNGGQQRGEKTVTAKLTEAQVREIRKRWPGETLRALGAEYGVSHTAIRRAVNGTKWGHVK